MQANIHSTYIPVVYQELSSNTLLGDPFGEFLINLLNTRVFHKELVVRDHLDIYELGLKVIYGVKLTQIEYILVKLPRKVVFTLVKTLGLDFGVYSDL